MYNLLFKYIAKAITNENRKYGFVMKLVKAFFLNSPMTIDACFVLDLLYGGYLKAIFYFLYLV